MGGALECCELLLELLSLFPHCRAKAAHRVERLENLLDAERRKTQRVPVFLRLRLVDSARGLEQQLDHPSDATDNFIIHATRPSDFSARYSETVRSIPFSKKMLGPNPIAPSRAPPSP